MVGLARGGEVGGINETVVGNDEMDRHSKPPSQLLRLPYTNQPTGQASKRAASEAADENTPARPDRDS